MRLLLDTNVLIRSIVAPRLVPGTVMAQMQDPANTVAISIVSVWEIALKHRIGKLPLDAGRAHAAILDTGADLLTVEPAHLFALERLPPIPGHADPFDHLLVAQALHEGLTLVTSDSTLAAYGVPVLPA